MAALLVFLFLAVAYAQDCTGTLRAIYVNKSDGVFTFGCVNENTGAFAELYAFDASIGAIEDGMSTGSTTNFYFVDAMNFSRIHQLDAMTGNLTDIGVAPLSPWLRTESLLIEWNSDDSDIVSLVTSGGAFNDLRKVGGKWVKAPGVEAYPPLIIASISSTGVPTTICTVNTTGFSWTKGGVSAYGANSFYFVAGILEGEYVVRYDLKTCLPFTTEVVEQDLYSIRYDSNYATGIIATGVVRTSGAAVILTFTTEGDATSWKVVYSYPSTDFFYGLGTQCYANNKVYAPMSGTRQVITTVDVTTLLESEANIPFGLFIADMQAGY